MRILMFCLSFLLFFNTAYAGDEETAEPVIEYIEMKPKFTVNLEKAGKYLVVNVQLMAEGEKYIEKIRKHLPALRHELIMLYSGRSSVDLQTMEQREALRVESKKAVTRALERLSNSDGFRDLFFTELLVN